MHNCTYKQHIIIFQIFIHFVLEIPVDQVVKAVINVPSFENDKDQVIQPDNSEVNNSSNIAWQ